MLQGRTTRGAGGHRIHALAVPAGSPDVTGICLSGLSKADRPPGWQHHPLCQGPGEKRRQRMQEPMPPVGAGTPHLTVSRLPPGLYTIHSPESSASGLGTNYVTHLAGLPAPIQQVVGPLGLQTHVSHPSLYTHTLLVLIPWGALTDTVS
ncbi:hypothetical protein VULLAG_LOCUS4380 [Vulpes lagopus]